MINKVYISYFYQIRFFTPDYLPISTAVWDPKWYHNFKDQSYLFRDKNNVVNGVRSQLLHPGHSCDGLCRGRETCETKDPTRCDFLRAYRNQLDNLNLQQLLSNLETYMAKVGAKYPVFIVHEAPQNPCSERTVLFEWFIDNGISCEEWSRAAIA